VNTEPNMVGGCDNDSNAPGESSLATSPTDGTATGEYSGGLAGPISAAALTARRALQHAWQAHLIGDRMGALIHLEVVRFGVAEMEDHEWPVAAFGLSLYAFTCCSIGEHEKAFAAAQRAASASRERDPRVNTPRAIRQRLASQLPEEPVSFRLSETIQRWALATAYRLPCARYRWVHEADLNRLRLALQSDTALACTEQHSEGRVG
jgi:hypothetical protein